MLSLWCPLTTTSHFQASDIFLTGVAAFFTAQQRTAVTALELIRPPALQLADHLALVAIILEPRAEQVRVQHAAQELCGREKM